MMLPPRPPSPPAGPPLGVNFSRMNETTPSPPRPALTTISALSTKIEAFPDQVLGAEAAAAAALAPFATGSTCTLRFAWNVTVPSVSA